MKQEYVEHVIEWTSIKGVENRVSVTFPSNSRWAGKMRKFAEKFPCADVIEDKNGYLFGHIPLEYIHIYPPRALSDEERANRSERMKQLKQQMTQ